ncbi:MAG: signal peptidase I [Polaromonas sp.]|nr:signal peptidase I [Polaromonas sp.]
MSNIQPRKPLVAMLMSLVLPGYGQLYNGQVNKAIWLFLAFALISVPGIAVIALYLPAVLTVPTLLLGTLAVIALWLFGIADAWQQAMLRQNYIPGLWQCSGAYAVMFLLCSGLALPLLIDYVRSYQVEPFRIPSSSMAPAVLQGDLLFADKRYNRAGWAGIPGGHTSSIARGDIAIFTYPNDRTLKYIKRIIGLPGDRIKIQNGEVQVNGVVLAPASPSPSTQVSDKQAMIGLDITVAAGQVFVMGDNRSNSKDSRDFGSVPMQDVVGRARQVWFSSGSDGVRWQRLGKVLE